MKPDEYRIAKQLAVEDGRNWDALTVAEVQHYLALARAELDCICHTLRQEDAGSFCPVHGENRRVERGPA